MIRYEGDGIMVRYDGTETLVWIKRAEKGRTGLTKDELVEVIRVLKDALHRRDVFDAGCQCPEDAPEPVCEYCCGYTS